MLKNPNYAKERGYEVRLSYNVNAPQVDTKRSIGIGFLRVERVKSISLSSHQAQKMPLER